MPVFVWSAPGDVPAVGDRAFDELLAGKLLPQDAAAGLRAAAEVIAGLTAASASGELAGEAGALAVFRGAAGMPDEHARSRPRRHRLLTSLLSAKLIAAVAIAAVTLGGGAVAAAAYTGALPASMQQLAHNTIGAPPAPHSASSAPSATPAGPDASGHAAYGLCTAYARLRAHGSAQQKAVAFRSLATAAGGAANVTAYCAGVAHPGTSPSGQPASHPTGQPGSMPSQAPTGHPSGRPSTLPSQAPATGQPASHPTGRPSAH